MTIDAERMAADLVRQAQDNTRWRRHECINLIPSEQPASAYVDALITADPGSRYNEHKHIMTSSPDAPDMCYYKGTSFIMEKENELKAALRTYFNCTRAEPRVISGQMANDTVYDALKAFRNHPQIGGQPRLISRVLVHDLIRGGHLSAQPMGALKNYLANDPETGQPAVVHFPCQADNPYRIDVEATKELILRTRPELLIFGRSVIIHTEPVKEIAAFIHAEFGADNVERPLIMYDAAHVLGLLGPYFQDPLSEGADIVTGSTHKTFFGPQRGVILSNIEADSPFDPLWRMIETRTFPGHVSNHHLGSMLGLLGAVYEMLQFRDDYPKQVIANAKAFAQALAYQGLSIEGDPACDFTETHQVLLRSTKGNGGYIADRLEANNVITNSQAFYDDPNFAAASGIRMGTQEMTRYGMDETSFQEFSELFAEIINDKTAKQQDLWRDQVKAFRARFADMRYCF